MMKKRFLCGLSAFAFGIALLNALSSGACALDITGYARTYAGMLLNAENEYAVLQNSVDINIEESRERVAMKINPYLYHYADKNRDANDDIELGLRQAYLDIYFDVCDLRIGKQQIIWGKADGVFITDVVSPRDMREFLLPDFEEIRIGVSAAKFDYYRGDQTFELVWVPIFTPTQSADDDSIWQVAPPLATQAIYDDSQEDVPTRVDNSELFAKYSLLGSRIDLEAIAAYAWDDSPTQHTTRLLDSETQQPAALTVRPEHHRLTIFGGSFNSVVGPVVVRGEGAYYSGKDFQSNAPELNDGVVQKDYLHYLIGADYTVWQTDISVQFIQQAILNYDESIENDQYDNMLTVRFKKDYLRDTLHLELFTYLGLNQQDALLRPKIRYDLADGFEILAGANIFSGDDGQFGQYDENDMVYAKMTYSF